MRLEVERYFVNEWRFVSLSRSAISILDDMDKMPLTKAEIEQLLIAELHDFAGCEEVSDIVVVPIDDRTGRNTWTVSRFNHGDLDADVCDRALRYVVPRFQRMYDMVRKH